MAADALYAEFSGLGIVQALFYGIAPAVMAIITIAAYKLLKLTDRRDRRLWAISATVFGVTALTGSEPIPLILAAGPGVLLLDARPKTLWPRLWCRAPRPPAGPEPPASRALLLPMTVLAAPVAGGTLLALGLFFLQTGALLFGSGLAIVPLLRDGVVAQHHRLDQGQFLDAVAMGLITPGPVVITAGFIGYLVGGFREPSWQRSGPPRPSPFSPSGCSGASKSTSPTLSSPPASSASCCTPDCRLRRLIADCGAGGGSA